MQLIYVYVFSKLEGFPISFQSFPSAAAGFVEHLQPIGFGLLEHLHPLLWVPGCRAGGMALAADPDASWLVDLLDDWVPDASPIWVEDLDEEAKQELICFIRNTPRS